MNPRKLLQRILSGSRNVRFGDMVGLVQAFFGGTGMKDYHINIFYSDEDGGYIADVPDLTRPDGRNQSGTDWQSVLRRCSRDARIIRTETLKACSAFGATPEEALREVEIAKDAWLKAARRAGKRIPKPKYRPVIYQVT